MLNNSKDSEDQSKKVNTEAGKGPLQNNDEKSKKAPVSKQESDNKGKAPEVKSVTVKK